MKNLIDIANVLMMAVCCFTSGMITGWTMRRVSRKSTAPSAPRWPVVVISSVGVPLRADSSSDPANQAPHGGDDHEDKPDDSTDV